MTILEIRKNNKRAMLKHFRNAEEIRPIEYKEATLDFDETAQRRLNIAMIALEGSDKTIIWTTADDGIIELNAEDIRQIFILGMLRANELHEKYRVLRDKVNIADTTDEVDLVEW